MANKAGGVERSGESLVIAGLIGCSVAAAVTEDVHGTHRIIIRSFGQELA